MAWFSVIKQPGILCGITVPLVIQISTHPSQQEIRTRKHGIAIELKELWELVHSSLDPTLYIMAGVNIIVLHWERVWASHRVVRSTEFDMQGQRDGSFLLAWCVGTHDRDQWSDVEAFSLLACVEYIPVQCTPQNRSTTKLGAYFTPKSTEWKKNISGFLRVLKRSSFTLPQIKALKHLKLEQKVLNS